MARAPYLARRVALPDGVRAYRGWMGDEGQSVISTLDGRFFSISPRGVATARPWLQPQAGSVGRGVLIICLPSG